MAVYKVAQDVEADDKLIGPFSFRQFIYLIIVALAIALAWGLSRLFVPLFIIPLPVILFFGALALPLRKDQPMEIYLAAVLSFYVKPRKRLWTPDGVESLVEITVPKVVEVQRAKDLSQSEAEKRLSYLADIADTGGWAIRHAAEPMANTAMNNDVWYAAQQTEDMLDISGGVAQSFDTKIAAADDQRRQEAIARMQLAAATPIVTQQVYGGPAAAPPVVPIQQQSIPQVATPQIAPQQPVQYATTMYQSVVSPLVADSAPAPHPVAMETAPQQSTPQIASNEIAKSTSEIPVSPDIINLANNSDLSIETIQREADRIAKKDEEEEVFISLH